MSKHLIVVESPAKAKTMTKYLGKEFMCLASYGHVRDLVPKEGAVDTEHGFAMKYEVIARNEKHVSKNSTLVEEIASTLVHETAHAHLYALGIGYPAALQVRIEKLCHRRELWFGNRIGSEAVCERAKDYLRQPDSFWAAEFQKTRWLDALKQYEISGWLERFFKYLIERRFA